MEKKRLKRELIDIYNNRDPLWSGPLKGNKVTKVTFARNPVLKFRYIALPIESAATHTPKHTEAATTIQKYWRRHQVFNELYSQTWTPKNWTPDFSDAALKRSLQQNYKL